MDDFVVGVDEGDVVVGVVLEVVGGVGDGGEGGFVVCGGGVGGDWVVGIY
ncbi:hypothetical protein GUF79_02150, partial [Xanthomonas citri pv. citri]|nr:hypothetical protein [Xanthomonas citri pv. citri]